MAQKRPNTRKRKKPLIIAGTVLAVVFIVLVGINSYLGHKIKNAVREKINKNPDSTLMITYGDINVNIYTGFIRIKNLEIGPGTKKEES
ncbi:MAG: hypothetical protein GXO89_13410, partial [Chlorobi bacterium]|nr:hypothetical protein [Chlorobiota bacterium]